MDELELRYPLALLLAVPAFAVAWRAWAVGAREKPVLVLRMLAVAALVLALAGPVHVRTDAGVDVVFLVDRSRSMPEDAEGRALELIALAERDRPPGGRLGVVSFGGEARVEAPPTASGRFDSFKSKVDPDASNLAEAIRTALAATDPDRALRLVLVTDGKPTGTSPLAAIPEAIERQVPIDARYLARPSDDPVSIVALDVPGQVDEGGPVLVSGWVRAERAGTYGYRLTRGGRVVEEGSVELGSGMRRLTFRDVLPEGPGIHGYQLDLLAESDSTPENNRARGVVRAVAPGRVLHVRIGDRPGHLGRALASPGVEVDSIDPADFPKSLEGLDPYRLIVLENVSVQDLGAPSLGRIATHVQRFGGGLLVTGGKRSFGVGGYYLSPLDPILPVSMELRTERRKVRMAIAMVLDRSGSMMAPAGAGLVKMDLANRGAVEVMKLLTRSDEVAVIAVDSEAHLVVPLTDLDDVDDVAKKTLAIESKGGGIYVYQGLFAAGNVLTKSSAQTRHVILFADAADAEEPGDYVNLLAKFQRAGITVSVIGLGSDADGDAGFLKDVAKRGGGRIFFSSEPSELPRLFSQDTLSVSQSTFVDEAIPGKWLSDIHLLGEPPASNFPGVRGYNVTYQRPGASVGAMTVEDEPSPIVAFWHRGTGRVGVFAAEVDGEFSGPLLGWPGYVPFFRTYGRWLLGPTEPRGVSLNLLREDPEAILRLEIDRTDPDSAKYLAETPTAVVVRADDPEGKPIEIPFLRVGEETFEARFPLSGAGTYLPVARLGAGTIVKAPPAVLPYSPEFRTGALGDELEGEALLDRLVEATGGTKNPPMSGLFESWGAESRSRSSLVPALALAALLLVVIEIAFRRMQLATHPIWGILAARLGLTRVAEAARKLRPAPRPAPARGEPAPVSSPQPAALDLPAAVPEPTEPVAPVSPVPAPPPPQSGGLSAALKKAKHRAGGRLGEGE